MQLIWRRSASARLSNHPINKTDFLVGRGRDPSLPELFALFEDFYALPTPKNVEIVCLIESHLEPLEGIVWWKIG
jgi:hypothetical protein